MGKRDPAWLPEAREFCRSSGIKIVGWGPDLLTVEAKSDERAKEIASQMERLGFQVVKNEDNPEAGLLDLSKNPQAIADKLATQQKDVSRRHWDEQIEPLIWALGSLLLVPGLFANPARNWRPVDLALGLLCVALFLWDGARMWGWRLSIAADEVRIRRYFRWATIPWEQIRSVENVDAGRGREAVVVRLPTHRSERLGSFGVPFARKFEIDYGWRLLSDEARRRRWSWRSESLVAGAVNYIDGVRQQVCDYVEGFDGAARAARKIDDNGFRANASDAARQQRALGGSSSFRAHVLGKSRYQPFHCGLRSFGRHVARAYSRAAGRQD
jgi:hypothetical protein